MKEFMMLGIYDARNVETIIVIVSEVKIKTNLVYIDMDTLVSIASEKCRFNLCIRLKKNCYLSESQDLLDLIRTRGGWQVNCLRVEPIP